MRNCEWCGEYKKVRKEYMPNGDGHQWTVWPAMISYDYVCKDCFDANNILLNEKEEKRKAREIKKMAEWKKQRDELLEKDSISCGKVVLLSEIERKVQT